MSARNENGRAGGSATVRAARRSAFNKWRNTLLGTLLVVGGLSAAAVTVLARQGENYVLAAAAAILSLLSAALMFIFVVPPLARSARLEVKRFDVPFEITSGGLIFTNSIC